MTKTKVTDEYVEDVDEDKAEVKAKHKVKEGGLLGKTLAEKEVKKKAETPS